MSIIKFESYILVEASELNEQHEKDVKTQVIQNGRQIL